MICLAIWSDFFKLIFDDLRLYIFLPDDRWQIDSLIFDSSQVYLNNYLYLVYDSLYSDAYDDAYNYFLPYFYIYSFLFFAYSYMGELFLYIFL